MCLVGTTPPLDSHLSCHCCWLVFASQLIFSYESSSYRLLGFNSYTLSHVGSSIPSYHHVPAGWYIDIVRGIQRHADKRVEGKLETNTCPKLPQLIQYQTPIMRLCFANSKGQVWPSPLEDQQNSIHAINNAQITRASGVINEITIVKQQII